MNIERDLKVEIKRCEDELSALKSELEAEEGVNGFTDASAKHVVARLAKELFDETGKGAEGRITAATREPHSTRGYWNYGRIPQTRQFTFQSPTLGLCVLKVTK